jgi:hypothetical protein
MSFVDWEMARQDEGENLHSLMEVPFNQFGYLLKGLRGDPLLFSMKADFVFEGGRHVS